MVENFSFAALSVDRRDQRLRVEESLLSTIFHCLDCRPSAAWLGKFHPRSAAIRESGLWNVQGLTGAVLVLEEAKRIVSAGTCECQIDPRSTRR
jgi:hypothetical protein